MHTLTFSSVNVKVNGVVVTSPHTLQNGDVIVAHWALEDESIIVNGTRYSSHDTTLNLSNTDINITTGSGSSVDSITVTINYTE